LAARLLGLALLAHLPRFSGGAMAVAADAHDLEAQTPSGMLATSGRAFGDLEAQEEDLEAQAEMMREQVDAFLKQQVCEAKRQVEQAQAARHLLQGCLCRVKEEPPCSDRAKLKACIPRGERSQSMPRNETAVDKEKNSDCGRKPMQLLLVKEHLQLKIALAASQANAAAAERKSTALQAHLDKVLQENAHLLDTSSDLQESEKLLMTRLKEKQEHIEHLQLERVQLRSSLVQRGDPNAVIRCLDALQRDYDKLVVEHTQLKQDAEPVTKLSAQVVSVEPLVLGIEVEDEEADGVMNDAFASALADAGCQQAFLMGRVRVPMDAGPAPVCVNVTIENDSDTPWPHTVAVVLVRGDAYGCPLLSLASASPGERVDLSMDLSVRAATHTGVASSMWAVVDASTGRTLGPLLVFEVVQATS